MIQIPAIDKISNELFKTDYKYLSLDVCKTAVLEELLKRVIKECVKNNISLMALEMVDTPMSKEVEDGQEASMTNRGIRGNSGCEDCIYRQGGIESPDCCGEYEQI